MVLTERQKKDLNEAILDYLISEGGDSYRNTILAFREEAQLQSFNDFGKAMLEKKWTGIVRLQKKVMDLEAQITSQAKLPSSLLASQANGESRLIPKGPAKSTLLGHRATITSITLHPVYTLMCTASEDASIKIWDYDSAQYERTLKGHTGPVTSVAYDSTGNLLASCSADMSAKLWDMNSFSCLKTLKGHDHTLSCIRFLPSNDQILTCSRDNTIKCWEVSSGFCIKTYSGHSDWVKCIAVSLDGSMFATGGMDHSILVWKVSSGQVLQVNIALININGIEIKRNSLSYLDFLFNFTSS
jgi:platelet-activating factor acetylhydrolase IB subunit alpha